MGGPTLTLPETARDCLAKNKITAWENEMNKMTAQDHLHVNKVIKCFNARVSNNDFSSYEGKEMTQKA